MIKLGSIDMKDRRWGATAILKVMKGDVEIWSSFKFFSEMIITDVQTADVYDFEHVFPNEGDGSTMTRGIVSNPDHKIFEAVYEFANISNATVADILITDSPIQNGDNLVIVKDDDSIHKMVASGVTGTSPYTMDTSAVTQGEIPTKVFTVDAQPSFAISGGYEDAVIKNESFTSFLVPAGAEQIWTKSSSATFIVPDDVHSLDVCMVGGGGTGAVVSNRHYNAGGGYGGQIISQVISVVPGEHIAFSCAARTGYNTMTAGSSGVLVGITGGTSTFKGLTATGGAGGTTDGVAYNVRARGGNRNSCLGSNSGGGQSIADSLYSYGGQAGAGAIGNGSDGKTGTGAVYSQDGFQGAGSGAVVKTTDTQIGRAGRGGSGNIKIKYSTPPTLKLRSNITYNDISDNIGSTTISPKVTLKSIGDRITSLTGTLVK